jgi:hypothetical protein
VIINELISKDRTDAELAAWLNESKWHVMDAINFEPDRGTSQNQIDTYYRVYRMAKAIQEPKPTAEATQIAAEYVGYVVSGDAYFSDRG